jgi:hypothetical protein
VRRLEWIGVKVRYLRYAPAVCIGLLLIFIFRLYTFAYFWNDDFGFLYTVQMQTFLEVVHNLISPSAQLFRPVGMLMYWFAFRLFDRDPLSYHLMMWVLHSLNVGLVYLTLKRFTGSKAGACVGALLYACPPVFNDIFFTFGIIFELTCATLFFSGMLMWQRDRRTLIVTLGATGLFFFAMKAKEMAITLPAIWFAQDLVMRRLSKWKDLLYFLMPCLFGLWFGLQRVSLMRSLDSHQAYYMDLRAIVLGRGFGYYFNELFGANIRWEKWVIGFVVLLILLLATKRRAAAFFQIYVFITFLPMIFVNQRAALYWYIPMFGVCGLAAILTRAIASRMCSRIPEERLAPYACVGFAVLCLGMYFYSSSATEPQRLWQQKVAVDYREFVQSVQARPTPLPGETLYFESMPEYFDTETLITASRFALLRPDIDAKLISKK